MTNPFDVRRVSLTLVLLAFGAAEPLLAQGRDSNPREPAASSPDVSPAYEDLVRQSVDRYVAAFNAGDAAAIGDLYAKDAELIDSGGNVFQGRSAIKREYEAFFKSHAGVSTRIILESVRRLTPTVVLEEGRTETKFANDDEQPTIFTRYMAFHGKEDDAWRMIHVCDFEVELDSGARLEQLSWLIGKWVDEDRDSLLEIDCYWHETGAYLIRDFNVRVEGLLATSGTERIGWDPLRRQVRSWLFDSEGGYLEGFWVRDRDQWTVTARGFRADGQPSQAMYQFTPLKKDAYHMASFSRFGGDEALEDLDMTIVRRPPPPTAASTDDVSDPGEANTRSIP